MQYTEVSYIVAYILRIEIFYPPLWTSVKLFVLCIYKDKILVLNKIEQNIAPQYRRGFGAVL
jgi:hypothetical protein